MTSRHVALQAALAVVACFGLVGCGGTATPSGSDSGQPDSVSESPTAEPSKKKRSSSPKPTSAKTGCEAAAETLQVSYGEPAAYSDIVAEGFERTWRHELPVTVTNPSEYTCLFHLRGELLVEGERAGVISRWIALRGQQTARLGDVPVLEEVVPFEPADAEAGEPTVEWEAKINKIRGQELAPDLYDFDVISTVPRQRADAEYKAGVWKMFTSYVLDTTVRLNAVDPAGKYPDIDESLKTPGVMTTIYINGLNADGDVVATWMRSQVVRDEFVFEIPSVGGGEIESGLTQRGDVFFQSLEAVESVVEYDVVTMQPMKMLNL